MRTRRQQLAEQTDFHEKDINDTKADRSECRRLKAETAEVFKTMRSQMDIFEKAVLENYDRFEQRCNERLERLEGKPPVEQQQNEPDKPTEGAEVHELNGRQKKAANS